MEFKLILDHKSKHIIVPEGSETWQMLQPDTSLETLLSNGASQLLTRDEVNYYLIPRPKTIKQYQSRYRKLVSSYHSYMQTPVVDLRNIQEEACQYILLSLGLSDYQLGHFKSDSEGVNIDAIGVWHHGQHSDLNRWALEAQVTAEVVKRTMSLVDAPSNLKTPQYIAQWCKKSAEQYQYNVEVLESEQLQQEGFHALQAVGQGSNNAPALLKIEWRNHAQADFHLGLVGKGVTFDTGGISLKKPSNMHYMKSDMGGAAAVLGAMELAARLQVPINLVAVVPLAENAIDAASVKPGDVIQSHSGKSIEIIDTDAEGRLILADALSFISKHYQPQRILDLATLTGSVVATLGSAAAGVFTNNQEMRAALLQAGTDSGERLWPLPLWEDYEEDLHSDVADIKNYSGKPIAGAITAAKFLEYFVPDFPNWAHLDIAGTAFDQVSGKMKSATGFGVRLIHAYIQLIINQD